MSLVETVIGIKTQHLSFEESMIFRMAKHNLIKFNEKNYEAWTNIVITRYRLKSRSNTLTPVIPIEYLEGNSLCMDGSKIETLGFTYTHPLITAELIKEILRDYIRKGNLPNINLL